MEDTEQAKLTKRLTELAGRAYAASRYVYTDFLGLSEQDTLRRCERELSYAGVKLFGGADGCERVKARFGSVELCGYDEPFPIACVEIAPVAQKFADDLSHRDVLGALMHLGIERDVLGDIYLDNNVAYVFCDPSMVPVILDGIDRVRHTTVSCREVPPPETVCGRTESRTVQVASDRADAIVAAVFHLSREDSQELFRQEKVFLNGRMTPSVSASVTPDTVVSVRGFGRFRYGGTVSLSKKGKLNVTVDVFV